MPIQVKCEGCGHELSVADAMAGKRGRCPECDAVVSIPAAPGQRPRGGAFARLPEQRQNRPGYGAVLFVSRLLGLMGFLLLLGIVAIGVYCGVKCFSEPENFQGVFGMFKGYAESVRDHSVWWGAGFILGGGLVGTLVFFLLAGAGQVLRLFMSIERTLADISDDLKK